MREPPRHIELALQDYHPDLGIIWDTKFDGWRFTYKGDPQPSILRHPDGEFIQDLYQDELIALLNQMDMHKNLDALEKSRLEQKRRIYEHNRSARRAMEQDVRPEMRKLADFTIERRRQPKPFSHVTDNPLAERH